MKSGAIFKEEPVRERRRKPRWEKKPGLEGEFRRWTGFNRKGGNAITTIGKKIVKHLERESGWKEP